MQACRERRRQTKEGPTGRYYDPVLLVDSSDDEASGEKERGDSGLVEVTPSRPAPDTLQPPPRIPDIHCDSRSCRVKKTKRNRIPGGKELVVLLDSSAVSSYLKSTSSSSSSSVLNSSSSSSSRSSPSSCVTLDGVTHSKPTRLVNGMEAHDDMSSPRAISVSPVPQLDGPVETPSPSSSSSSSGDTIEIYKLQAGSEWHR